MSRTATSRVTTVFTACSNCDRPLPGTATSQSFCSDPCRAIAHEIRDLRRLRAAGIETTTQTQALTPNLRARVESAIPLRGCDAEDWSTFIQWFQDAEQR